MVCEGSTCKKDFPIFNFNNTIGPEGYKGD